MRKGGESGTCQSACVCVCLHPCCTHWWQGHYDNAPVLATHNGNTPHAVPSIAAKCPQNYAPQTSHYPHKVLRKQTHTHTHASKSTAETSSRIGAVTNIKTKQRGTQKDEWQQWIKRVWGCGFWWCWLGQTNRSVMGLTEGVKGGWRLLDMKNQKRPSRWLPVRLTSVKTSPSFSAEELHLPYKPRKWVAFYKVQ